MKYGICSGTSSTKLEQDVKFWLERGWKPQGGVCISLSGDYLLQAIIKEDR
ncbi:hypothetical protein [Shimia sp.]|uniref:hypothetical protein n=1 Tax=Shimia sp. TaxID=1954381 RepID=UPI003BAC78A4